MLCWPNAKGSNVTLYAIVENGHWSGRQVWYSLVQFSFSWKFILYQMETTSIISLVKESIQLPHLCVQGAEPQLLSSVHTDLSGEGVVSGWELQHLLVQVFLFSSYEPTSVISIFWWSCTGLLVDLSFLAWIDMRLKKAFGISVSEWSELLQLGRGNR